MKNYHVRTQGAMMNNDLVFLDNFITTQEEQSIVESIIFYKQQNPKLVANYGSNNYGSIYFGERYKKEPLVFPDFIKNLCDKLIDNKLVKEYPFGVAINEYQKGQKIGPHIDKPISGPIVTILSLNSNATMLFKKKGESDIVQELTSRSIIQMKGDIRDNWTHEILPVKDLRISIIFRSLK
jgi:alkylated DNA repair dioxygenase AlkB